MRRPAILVALACVLAYSTSLSGPFVFDDRGTIVDNPTIEDVGSRRVLSAPHETPTAGRPVVNVSFALNYAWGGREVTGYHVANIAIHLLCGLTILGIARRTLPSAGAALATALLWTLHPLNTEAVNYVTQRTESLMALSYLLTLYCAVRAYGARKRRGRWHAAAVVACAVGMASKESMVTAPLAVLLYDRIFLFPSFRDALKVRSRLYAGLAATWLVLAGLVWSAPRNLSAGFSAHDADVWTYLLNQAVMLTRYLWLTIWPRPLVLYYGWPLPLDLAAVWPQALLILALLAGTVVALWRVPRIGFAGAWFFLTLAPTSSVLPIATEVGAERRMYLALVPLVALGVMAGRRWIPDARVRIASVAIVAALFAAGTLARSAEYQSSLRLAETTHERWPTPASHAMLGTELAAAGRLADAEAHLRQAADVHPPARYYLATVLNAQGNHREAIPLFEAFIAGQPPELDQVLQARALLADALTKEQRFGDATTQYLALLNSRPDDDQSMVLLAQVLLRQQRFVEAAEWYGKAVAARPGDVSARIGLGIALASSGRLDDAIASFRRAVDLDPENPHARQNLARALALRDRGGS